MELKREQIVYVDNKPHIKAKVIMLPMNKTSTLGDIVISKITKILQIFDSPVGQCNFISQHLYITSDEEIKEGDWCYSELTGIFQYLSYSEPTLNCFKIIATTDSSLGLPNISQQFIEKYIICYNNWDIIVNILVEIEKDLFTSLTKMELSFIKDSIMTEDEIRESWYLKLKLDSKNTITIRKQKDNWNREELQIFKNVEGYNHLEFIYERLKNVHGEDSNYDYMLKLKSICNWIEENL